MLAETLASLKLQREIDPARVEVIVVDNNSSDATRATVEQAQAEWPLGTLRYCFERRQGKQFALNLGLQQATFDVLAFTDDDINFHELWLSRVERFFAETDVELAGGRTLLAWPKSGPPDWFAEDMRAILAGVDNGEHRLAPAPPEYAPAGSNLIARRQLFQRFGPYSEAHFRHMDHEFGIRCNSGGAKVVYEPSLEVYAPVDERCLTKRYFRRWSWKAGIASTGGIEAVAQRPAVPRWMFRQLLGDAAYLATSGLAAPPHIRFGRELRFWRCLGGMANVWHSRWRPATHARWVVAFSQKKNNTLF